ncbi:MAG: hypothetical protein GX072_12000 [Lysinibacillus sp.]|nr:hypothetical protein [Lysinibacillus sp.]
MLRRHKGKLFASLLFATLLVAGCSGGDSSSTQSEEDNTASEATQERQIVVMGDTINSHFQTDAICVVDSRFERGHSIVFRASVIDQATNELVEDAKVKVAFATGDEYDMELGPHGAEGTLLWTVLWTVPDDFPTGTLDYKIIAEVDGKEYAYEPFDVSLSKLTILEKGEEAKIAEQAQAAAEQEAEGAEESTDDNASDESSTEGEEA